MGGTPPTSVGYWLQPQIHAMGYSTGCRTTFHHRYHLVWAPKYRYKVLHGEVRLRVREIIRQVCDNPSTTLRRA